MLAVPDVFLWACELIVTQVALGSECDIALKSSNSELKRQLWQGFCFVSRKSL